MSFNTNELIDSIAKTASVWADSVTDCYDAKEIECTARVLQALACVMCAVREFDKQYRGAPSNNIAPDGYGYAIVDGDNDILYDYCNFYSVSLFIAGTHNVAWFKTKAGAEDAIAAFGFDAKAALLNKATLQRRNSDA